MKRETTSPQETAALAAEVAASLPSGACLALVGELGAGKTCFVRGLVTALGGDVDDVSSPTFAIVHEHAIGDGRRLAHVDAYRLGGVDELTEVGWDELLACPETIVAVEWADRIPAAIPGDAICVHLAHLGDELRLITITQPQGGGVCRTCGEDLDGKDDLFCGERCRLADLGRWFDERFTVSRPVDADDLDD